MVPSVRRLSLIQRQRFPSRHEDSVSRSAQDWGTPLPTLTPGSGSVEHAPADCRESMLAKVRLHREIAAAAREQGLPLAADSSYDGGERGSADA